MLFRSVSGYDGHRRCACSVLRHNMPPLLLPSPVQVKAMELYGMFIYLLCYEIWKGDWSSDVCSSDLMKDGSGRVESMLNFDQFRKRSHG